MLLLFPHSSILLINFSLLIISELVLIIFSSSKRIFFWSNERKCGIQRKSSPDPTFLLLSLENQKSTSNFLFLYKLTDLVLFVCFTLQIIFFGEELYQLLVRELPLIPMIPHRKPGCLFSRAKAQDQAVGEFQNFDNLNGQYESI